MTNTIQKYIATLAEGKDLLREEARNAFQIIMNGGATPAQMAAFLVALRMKGESVDELLAGAETMRAKALPFHAPENAIDTCGTGGDAKGTLNISTAVAIVVAACGVPVAKHGNRSISSKSGSSDILAALEVDVNAPVNVMEEALQHCNLAFLMAPRFHQAMRHVAPVRLELGIRTIFNLLGPLSNPAKPKRQVIGVYAAQWQEPIARVLRELGCERAWVVHGSDGMDELTTTGTSHVVELHQGQICHFDINPENFGIPLVTLEQLKGKDPLYNAQQLTHLLNGEAGAYRDIVLLNAAAALIVAGKAETLKNGMELAAQAIDDRKAKETLASLASLSRNYEIASPILAKYPHE